MLRLRAIDLAEATDGDIIRQLIEVGKMPLPRRRKSHIMPKVQPGDPNQLRWLRASDVGYSTSTDRRLVRRLNELARRRLISKMRDRGIYRANSDVVPSDEEISAASALAEVSHPQGSLRLWV